MKICIDPGHSGPVEPGACAGGVTEAAITLEIAKITAKMLEKFRHTVLLTRTGTVDNDWLTWRCEAAWNFGADIFISIHCNAHASPAAHGTEVFYYPGSESGHALARCIQAELVALCPGASKRTTNGRCCWKQPALPCWWNWPSSPMTRNGKC